ncbi:hypothetical protein D3C81_1713300 [compost metagenome]
MTGIRLMKKSSSVKIFCPEIIQKNSVEMNGRSTLRMAARTIFSVKARSTQNTIVLMQIGSNEPLINGSRPRPNTPR